VMSLCCCTGRNSNRCRCPSMQSRRRLRPVQGSSSVLPVYSFVFVVFGRCGGIRVARVRARSTRTRRAQRRRRCARNGPRVRNLPQRGPVPQA
jgi:hypothetical protein